MTLFQTEHLKYQNRESEIRAELSPEKIIQKIKSYGADYDLLNTNFDIYDQLLACESIEEVLARTSANTRMNDNGNVKWNGNGGSKRILNAYKTQSEHQLNKTDTSTRYF